MLLNENRTKIGDRYYMVCAEKCYDVDGEELKGAYCGALVDVTDMKVVRVAECQCGIESNHRSTYNGRTA